MTKFSDWHIYFGGSGFSNAFYIGVVKALQERFPNEIPIISADSAGTLVALAYAFNIPWDKIRELYLIELRKEAKRGNKLWFGKISDDHDSVISNILKEGDFKKIQYNDKFRVGITKFFMKYQIITNWNNEDELRDHMHRSMTIPLIVKTKFAMEIDGAYTTDQLYDLTIGTAGNNDISLYTSWYQKITPPTEKEVEKLINLGYLLTMKYDFTKKEKHLPVIKNQTFTIIFLWLLKFISIFLKICNIID
tara:strand:+ start:368 stop:1114 length:747 start_codon:yes stop_codon:yes gene_type:complete